LQAKRPDILKTVVVPGGTLGIGLKGENSAATGSAELGINE